MDPNNDNNTNITSTQMVAKTTYIDAETRCCELLAELGTTVAAADRARLLELMAQQVSIQAAVYPTAFGTAAVDTAGHDGRTRWLTRTESLWHITAVLGSLAAVETARATGGDWRPGAFLLLAEADVAAQAAAVAAALAELAEVTAGDAAYALLAEDLHDALLPVVGGYAAQIATIIADTLPDRLEDPTVLTIWVEPAGAEATKHLLVQGMTGEGKTRPPTTGRGGWCWPGWARRLIDRVSARRAYRRLSEAASDAATDLWQIEVPERRAALLGELARTLEQLGQIHGRAFGRDPIPEEGGREMAESVAAEADLFWLAASAERALAAPGVQWTAVDDLRAGQRLLADGEYAEVVYAGAGTAALTQDPGEWPGDEIEVAAAGEDGELRWRSYDAGETVRTGGSLDVEVVELAASYGAGPAELGQWWRLATTRDREARAEILTHLHVLAAGRVGAQAAEGLRLLADTEVHLAGEAAGHPHPWRWMHCPSVRWPFATAFFGTGAAATLHHIAAPAPLVQAVLTASWAVLAGWLAANIVATWRAARSEGGGR